jgi:hypothetical protein
MIRSTLVASENRSSKQEREQRSIKFVCFCSLRRIQFVSRIRSSRCFRRPHSSACLACVCVRVFSVLCARPLVVCCLVRVALSR